MDAYQLTGLCLQGVIAITLLVGVVIAFRATVRQEGGITNQQKAIDALGRTSADLLAEVKGRLPAIERAAGASHESLTEVCGQLRTLDKTTAEALPELRKLADTVGQGNAQSGKLAEAVNRIGIILGELTGVAAAIEKTSGHGLAATRKVAEEVVKFREDLIETTRF